MIRYSAPAKVILSGEHAAVYGKPALVSAIDLRLEFIILPLNKLSPDIFLTKEIVLIINKVKNFLRNEKISYLDKTFDYKIESKIPIGRGLGSSAAFSVATVAAFLEFYSGQLFKKEIINQLAFEIEEYFHHKPSGVDNSASCYGGLILYQKGLGLKNLNFKIPKNIEEKLFLIDSGKPEESTKEMVELVARKSLKKNILDEIEIITKGLEKALLKENIYQLKKTLIDNQRLLEKLGVVSEKTKRLLKDLAKFGVGKITGAGGQKAGSGFVLFLAEDKKGLIEYLRSKKNLYYKFIPDEKGLIRL